MKLRRSTDKWELERIFLWHRRNAVRSHQLFMSWNGTVNGSTTTDLKDWIKRPMYLLSFSTEKPFFPKGLYIQKCHWCCTPVLRIELNHNQVAIAILLPSWIKLKHTSSEWMTEWVGFVSNQNAFFLSFIFGIWDGQRERKIESAADKKKAVRDSYEMIMLFQRQQTRMLIFVMRQPRQMNTQYVCMIVFSLWVFFFRSSGFHFDSILCY